MRICFILFLLFTYSTTFSQCDTLVIYTVADNSEQFIPIDCNVATPYDFIEGSVGDMGNETTLKEENKNYPFTELKQANDDYNLLDYPIRTNVALVWGNENIDQNATCSGTIISENMVITDAHCIGSVNSLNQFVWKGGRGLHVSPAHQNGYPQATIGKVKVTHIIIQRKFHKYKNNYDYDFALLILEKPIGKSIGYMGVSYHEIESPLNDSTLSYTFGYPGTDGYDGRNMYTSYGYINSSNWYYRFSSGVGYVQGQSGSSIFNYNPETNLPSVYGLLVYGNPVHNFQRIRKEQFAAILKIKEDYKVLSTSEWKENISNSKITVYPIPTRNNITVNNLLTNSLESYHIVNQLGQTVITGKVNTNKEIISIQNLPSGIYFFKAENEKLLYSQKIILQ